MKTLMTILLALGLAPSAYADLAPDFGEPAPVRHESSRWFQLELKFGPYSPNIDASPGLHGHPFAEVFDTGSHKGRPPGRLLGGVELDFEFFHRFGTLAVGAYAGLTRRSSHGLEYIINPGAAPTPCTAGINCVASGDTTTLNVVPLELLAIYRFDVLALKWHVPLVPYFKVGLAYYIWWIENGGGAFSTATFPVSGTPKQSAYGGTFGFVLRPGISLLLDVLDPQAARAMDTETGINHSYIFFELHYADITGFGASNKMTLSDTTFATGLAFEF